MESRAGQLSLHPGNGCAAFRPTMDRSYGRKRGGTHFGAVLPGDSGAMQVAVRKNGVMIWTATDSGAFNLTTLVSPGDTIDFAVYGGYGYGSTPLDAAHNGGGRCHTRTGFDDRFLEHGRWENRGGTISESGGAELVFTSSGGTLDGVTANADLDLASNNSANVHIVNGLTLNNATVRLGNAAGSTYGQMYFDTTETLGGTGTVVFGKSGSNFLGCKPSYGTARVHADDRSGDHGAGQQRHLREGDYWRNGTIINQGTIAADDSGGLVGGFAYDTGFSGG